MWGIFVGMAIGVGQVLALKQLSSMILGDTSTLKKLVGSLLLFVKMALIVLILYLLSTVSLTHLIWAAGGLLIGLTTVSITLITRNKKTDGDEHVDRELDD